MRRNAANWLHRHAARRATLLHFTMNVIPATVDGRTWSAATDTRSIVAVDDGGQLVHEAESMAGFGRFRPELDRLLELSADSWRETVLPDLWDWLAFSRRDVCSECRAILAQEHDGDCTTCDQSGFVEAEDVRLGQIGGAVVSVEQLLQSLPPELLDFGGADGSQLCRYGSAAGRDAASRDGPYFLIRGDRWRMLMMGYYREDEAERMRTSPRYLPGVGPLWHARHHPIGRLILADWYEENGEPEYAAHLREHEPPW